MRRLSSTQSAVRRIASSTAFSLIELLVVIGIIGLIAALGLPALRGLTGGNAMEHAKRQLIDDLSIARQRAMAERTTVFVLFVPPGLDTLQQTKASVTNLYNLQLTSYALFTRRSVGEQPGVVRPRYLTEWRQLPEGVFIPDLKFDSTPKGLFWTNDLYRSLPVTNFPYFGVLRNNATYAPSNNIPFRYLAFNAQGQLESPSARDAAIGRRDEYIPLAKGSIFYDKQKGTIDAVPTPRDNLTNNFVGVSALTGRAKAVQKEIR